MNHTISDVIPNRRKAAVGNLLSATTEFSQVARRVQTGQLSLRYSRLRIASRRAALAPLSALSGSPDFDPELASSSLHDGHRLANPGFPGFNSNSSPQATQVLMGYVGILILFYRALAESRFLTAASRPFRNAMSMGSSIID